MKNGNSSPTLARWRLRPAEQRTLLFVGDFVFAWVSFLLAVYFWARAMTFNTMPVIQFARLRLENWFYLLPIIWMILLIDNYDRRTSSDIKRTLRGIGVSAVIGGVLYLVVYFTSDTSLPRRCSSLFRLCSRIDSVVAFYLHKDLFHDKVYAQGFPDWSR